MLADIKLALGISDNLYDTEITGFIESARRDLSFGNVDTVSTTDALTKTAIIAYCCSMFHELHGDMQRAELLRKSYENLKMQMGTNSHYRNFDGESEDD